MSNDLTVNMRGAEQTRRHEERRRRALNDAARDLRAKHQAELEQWIRSRTSDEAVYLHDELRRSYAEGHKQADQLIECPHWQPGTTTMRRGCTACTASQDRSE